VSRRRLSPWEVVEGRRVFSDSLDWQRVQVVEQASWPLALSRAAARLQRRPPPAHNAVTLGHRIFFSRQLRTEPSELPSHRRSDLAWLIHELTHVWQHEHLGSGAFWRTVKLHLRPGIDPYDYGGAAGLSTGPRAKALTDFTLEQQAEIARDYYARLDAGEDTRRWNPVVEPLRRA